MRAVAGIIAVLITLGLTGFSCSRAVSASAHSAASSSPAASTAVKSPSASPGASKAPGTASSPSTGKSPGAATTAGAKMAASTATTKKYTMKVRGLTRSYEVIAPVRALPKTAPVIVSLAGFRASVTTEMARDQLIPYAAAGMAEVVYPVGLGESWNAIGCCGYASTHKVDDLGFLKALVAKLDPGHARHIFLVGYSNGARLAYRVACTTPALFDGYGMVKGGPMANCVVTKPASVIQIASLDDPEVAYKPGQKGREPLPVTTETARLHKALKCAAPSSVIHPGSMYAWTTWKNCAGGSRLALAVWKDGKHSFPRPPASVPGAAPVMWAFFTNRGLAPLP
jgi:polyhydroxybutyrate depolymerase